MQGVLKLASGRSVVSAMVIAAVVGVSSLSPGVEHQSRPAERSAAMPDWLREHMQYMIADGGRWIADNGEHTSDAEPFDAYGIEWQWGIGEESICGRLFAIRDGKQLGDIWEMRLYWHPGEKAAIAQQFGSDGTYSEGQMTFVDGDIEITQTFFSAAGESSQIHHVSEETGPHEHRTKVASIVEGTRYPGRTYTWSRQRKNERR